MCSMSSSLLLESFGKVYEHHKSYIFIGHAYRLYVLSAHAHNLAQYAGKGHV